MAFGEPKPPCDHGEHVTQQDYETLQDAIRVSFERVLGNLNPRMAAVEKISDTLEETVATLVVGFAEQAVMIEAILGHLTFASPEEQAAFAKTVSEGRAAMFKIMQEQVDVLADSDPDLASAMERVVEEKQSPPTSE